MAQEQDSKKKLIYQAALFEDRNFLCEMVTEVVQQILDQEFTEHLSAGSYERTESRQGYRNGSYQREYHTRVGSLQLRIPRDREGHFQTSLFARYQRHEQALLLTLMEMTINGVSTRKVAKVTEQLCGTSFSKSLVSSLSTALDQQLTAWRTRRLSGTWPYLYVDALYEKVRVDGRVRSMAEIIVVGVNAEGRRSVLAVEVRHSENEADYGAVFRNLLDRGLRGVQLVISDDHTGLVKTIQRYFQGASWQRCQVHFLRNLSSRVRSRDRSWVLSSMKDVFAAPDYAQAQARLQFLVDQLEAGYPELSTWLEDAAPDILGCFSFPEAHRKRIRSTNGLERLNEEIRRRTRVIRIFPNRLSCLRMASALCQAQDEEWETGKRYLDMSLLAQENPEQDVEITQRAV